MEQRYQAVMEVVSGGVPVVESTERYGVSRKGSVRRRRPVRRVRSGFLGLLCRLDTGKVLVRLDERSV